MADRLAGAWDDYVVALRSNDGFKQELFDKLVSVIRECEREWRDADTIPRLAVNVLVDVVPASQSAGDAYPEPVRQQVYDASFELYDLIIECVGVEPR